MAVNEQGKYTKLEPTTIKKLEEAFAMDCSITEACLYANIRTQTYYNWIKDNPKLKERFDELRETPILKARSAVFKGLDNYQNGMDYLKRKRSKEFGDNTKVEIKDETNKELETKNSKEIDKLKQQFEKELKSKLLK